MIFFISNFYIFNFTFFRQICCGLSANWLNWSRENLAETTQTKTKTDYIKSSMPRPSCSSTTLASMLLLTPNSTSLVHCHRLSSLNKPHLTICLAKTQVRLLSSFNSSKSTKFKWNRRILTGSLLYSNTFYGQNRVQWPHNSDFSSYILI